VRFRRGSGEDEPNVIQANAAALHHVHKTTRRRDKQIAAALNVAKLAADVGSTIDNTGSHA
jgi:hypothetical protein